MEERCQLKKAKIVTPEMLQWDTLNKAEGEIHAAIWRGSSLSAKRRIKGLMTKLV